jgi:hypothetical protein
MDARGDELFIISLPDTIAKKSTAELARTDSARREEI